MAGCKIDFLCTLHPIKKLFILEMFGIPFVWWNWVDEDAHQFRPLNFFPSLSVPQQLLPWLDSATRERHSSLLKIMYLFSHAYLITGICFCRWWFSSFYFCPGVNICLFCSCKFFKFQFSGLRNWPGSMAGRGHPAQSRASSFSLLEWGGEKEALSESCHGFF